MQLRPRQIQFVDRCTAAIKEHGNTLGIAPTGAGKTVMLSALLRNLPQPSLVLQHRIELVTQNRRTYHRVNPRAPSDEWTATQKRWEPAGPTFGMVQSVVNAISEAPAFGSVVVDEAHHIAANSYLRIVDSMRKKNPDLKILGVTATPERGDKRALRGVFDNVGDQINIMELIDAGFLVRPRTFVVDVGTQAELKDVRKGASDFNMDEVAAIMDKDVVTARIVEEWKLRAGDRLTVAFAATVAHANHVSEAFRAAGVPSAVVDGAMSEGERERVLAAFDRGETRVLVNVAVLTEGWDCQPVSCIMLLRPSSYKSTMIQMIGRGLRTVDPERYPSITKADCMVLDFGTSILTHGSLETSADLDGKGGLKECPGCQAKVPATCSECPLCGFEFPKQEVLPKVCEACGTENAPSALKCKECGELLREPKEKGELSTFVMTEVELLQQSPFRWESLWDGAVMMAASFEAWAACIFYQGAWHTVAQAQEVGIKLVARTPDRLIALAAGDDWMREHSDNDVANKTKRWLNQPPSDKQLAALGMKPSDAFGLTKYRAACLLSWKWSASAIQKRVTEAASAAQKVRVTA
jgi:DNA repair protein RadD